MQTKFLLASSNIKHVSLVNHFKTCIWNKGTWNTYTLFCLIVLQECCYNAGQGQSGAVQGVAELGLLGFAIAKTALQTVGLIGVEV